LHPVSFPSGTRSSRLALRRRSHLLRSPSVGFSQPPDAGRAAVAFRFEPRPKGRRPSNQPRPPGGSGGVPTSPRSVLEPGLPPRLGVLVVEDPRRVPVPAVVRAAALPGGYRAAEVALRLPAEPALAVVQGPDEGHGVVGRVGGAPRRRPVIRQATGHHL